LLLFGISFKFTRPFNLIQIKPAQLAGLHDTINGIVLIIGFALVLSIWSVMLERMKSRRKRKELKQFDFYFLIFNLDIIFR
jgi:hypothetical protein